MKRDIFQAIADPTRRAILTLLIAQAMTPNAIADNFTSSRQAVSKHLKVMTDCGVLKRQQTTGREVYYHINPQKMKEIDLWMERFRKLWDDKFNQLDDVLKNL
jgi:DNA-binding transcriptional ArsR family regulator